MTAEPRDSAASACAPASPRSGARARAVPPGGRAGRPAPAAVPSPEPPEQVLASPPPHSARNAAGRAVPGDRPGLASREPGTRRVPQILTTAPLGAPGDTVQGLRGQEARDAIRKAQSTLARGQRNARGHRGRRDPLGNVGPGMIVRPPQTGGSDGAA